MRPRTVATLLLLFACAEPRVGNVVPDSVSTAGNGLHAGIGARDVAFVANVDGFQGPESVRYDPEQDVYFVSNMAGYGSAKDGNGYISRLSAADGGSAVVFVESGKNGATLDAPKGMAIHGDTLWVADINVLRGFHRRTGMPLGEVDFTPRNAVLLNDVAVAPDGSIRVTDTGILMSDVGVIYVGGERVFSLGPNRAITVVDSGPRLKRPNGIAWDRAGGRWVVVSFDPFKGEVAAMPPRDSGRTVLETGPGKMDGVEVLANGAIVYASWTDSSLHLLEKGRDRRIVREIPEPADIGLDTRRNRVAIPLSTLGRVQIWSLGRIGAQGDAR